MVIVGAIALLALCAVVAAEDYCYSQDTDPYNLFASKTIYDLVRNRKGQIAQVPNCNPVLVWGFFRHATRYPDTYQLKELKDLQNLRDNILQNHNLAPHSQYQSAQYRVELGGELCWGDLELLRDWSYNVTEADAGLITSSGVQEMYLLGKRLKTDFPPLDATYTQERFKIRFSEMQRTKQTADAFLLGLFGHKIDLPDSFRDDKLTKPNQNCTNWQASTKSEGAEKQIKSFRNGPLMKHLISAVSKRLGFKYDLTLGVIKDMYTMCTFDKAWQPKQQHSPWCAAFTKEHLQVMEYDEDLRTYNSAGYRNPFSSVLGCPLVADMIQTFHNRTQMNDQDSEPSAILYFSHSLMLRSMLVRLGMARDKVPLTADNYATQDRRQWRNSLISPFAGNLVAVLYKCGDQFKVMFYLNEQYIDYEGCNVGLCNWTYIYERFSPIVNPSTCNLNFCNTSFANSLVSSAGLFLLTFLLALWQQ